MTKPRSIEFMIRKRIDSDIFHPKTIVLLKIYQEVK